MKLRLIETSPLSYGLLSVAKHYARAVSMAYSVRIACLCVCVCICFGLGEKLNNRRAASATMCLRRLNR